MATKYDFKVGDVVKVRGQPESPTMTINALWRETCDVVWFVKNDLHAQISIITQSRLFVSEDMPCFNNGKIYG